MRCKTARTRLKNDDVIVGRERRAKGLAYQLTWLDRSEAGRSEPATRTEKYSTTALADTKTRFVLAAVSPSMPKMLGDSLGRAKPA